MLVPSLPSSQIVTLEVKPAPALFLLILSLMGVGGDPLVGDCAGSLGEWSAIICGILLSEAAELDTSVFLST